MNGFSKMYYSSKKDNWDTLIGNLQLMGYSSLKQAIYTFYDSVLSCVKR